MYTERETSSSGLLGRLMHQTSLRDKKRLLKEVQRRMNLTPTLKHAVFEQTLKNVNEQGWGQGLYSLK